MTLPLFSLFLAILASPFAMANESLLLEQFQHMQRQVGGHISTRMSRCRASPGRPALPKKLADFATNNSPCPKHSTIRLLSAALFATDCLIKILIKRFGEQSVKSAAEKSANRPARTVCESPAKQSANRPPKSSAKRSDAAERKLAAYRSRSCRRSLTARATEEGPGTGNGARPPWPATTSRPHSA